MIRRILIEFVLPLILFLIVRNLFRGSSSSSPSPARREPPPAPSAGGDLKKDPVCGTYVAAGASLSRRIGSETFYFCSPECRDRYQA